MTPTLASTSRRTGSPQRSFDSQATTALPVELGLPPSHRTASLVVKYVIDRLLAGLFLLVSAPFFLAIAAAIKLSSRGPVFFIQRRVGQRGRIFDFYKFRTMYHNADDTVHREFSRDFIRGGKSGAHAHGNGNGNGNGKVYKLTRDPRVTGIGQFLRRTSLDELPQLLNVLRGEMSLVGPRPPVLYELEHYQEWHKLRLTARPGLTGLWQVSGRSSVPFDEMVLLDLHYIERRSTWMDLWIMLKTLPVMLKGSGGY